MRQLKPSKFVSAKKPQITHLPGNDYMLYVHMFENKCAIYSTNSHDLLQLETFFGYEL